LATQLLQGLVKLRAEVVFQAVEQMVHFTLENPDSEQQAVDCVSVLLDQVLRQGRVRLRSPVEWPSVAGVFVLLGDPDSAL